MKIYFFAMTLSVLSQSLFGSELLTNKLKERFGANIEVVYLTDLGKFNIKSARFIEERSMGRFDFFINGEEKIQIEANVFVSALFPKSRIQPRQLLNDDLFEVKKVNIVRSAARDTRSIILSASESMNGMQSRLTLLPGEFLTIHSIQKAPVVKVGDRAQMKLWVGGVLLNTPVIIQQEGQIGDSIRVEVQSTKRIMQGTLMDPQTVEIRI